MATTETPEHDSTVGQRIRWARRQTGLSQEKLALEIGTTRQVVIRWERDKHLPNSASRERLGDALKQEPDFFADTEAALLGDPFRGSSEAAASGRGGKRGRGSGPAGEVAA